MRPDAGRGTRLGPAPRASGARFGDSTVGSIVTGLARSLAGDLDRAHNDARWALAGELRHLRVTGPGGGRLLLGRSARSQRGSIISGSTRSHRPLLATEKRHSVMVVGPTQTYKTSGFAIPAILEWEGPVLAASVKGDLLSETYAWRSCLGECWVFDPASSTSWGSDGWCPLSACLDWVGARRVASSLSRLANRGGLEDGEFWYAASAKLLAPLLFAAATAGLTMADVVRWVDTQESDEVLSVLQRSGCKQALHAWWASSNRETRQKSSIYTTAETVLEPFGDPEVGDIRIGWGIDVDRFLDGASHTVYLSSPSHEQARLQPLFCALVEQIINAVYDRSSRVGAPLSPPLLVVLDEAANIAPLATLDGLASTAASHGIQLVTVWQDFSQLRSRYGERADTIVNNHRAKMFLSGISDVETLDYASRLGGEARFRSSSTTRGSRGERSTTWQPESRSLMPGASVRRIAPGTGVLFYGHLPPACLTLRPWFADPELARRANGQPAQPITPRARNSIT